MPENESPAATDQVANGAGIEVSERSFYTTPPDTAQKPHPALVRLAELLVQCDDEDDASGGAA